MSRILLGTRYLILVPILGLTLAAGFAFVLGGVSLIRLLFELLLDTLGRTHETAGEEEIVVMYEVLEHVHTFLVGTVLYITAVGLYQLFVQELAFPGWLKVNNTEELETNLIGVTVVVLAVNFMGATFRGAIDNLLQYGAGIALPIAALGLFVALRAWATKITDEAGATHEGSKHAPATKPASQEPLEREI